MKVLAAPIILTSWSTESPSRPGPRIATVSAGSIPPRSMAWSAMTTWFTITASSHFMDSGILWRLFGGATPYSLESAVRRMAEELVAAVRLHGVLADVVLAPDAGGAFAAADRRLHDDAIAYLKSRFRAASDSGHLPRPLVSLDEGIIGRPHRAHVPFVDVDVGAADAAGGDLHQHLAGFVVGHGNLLDAHLVRVMRDGGFHGFRNIAHLTPLLRLRGYRL